MQEGSINALTSTSTSIMMLDSAVSRNRALGELQMNVSTSKSYLYILVPLKRDQSIASKMMKYLQMLPNNSMRGLRWRVSQLRGV
jgi:hypothetical protein